MKILLLLICAVLSLSILAAGCTSPAPVPTTTTVPTPVATTTTPAPLTDPALIGTWNLKGGIIGASTPVIPNVQVTLTFKNDGTLTGFSGCNNYNGGYVLSGQTTEFGKGISIGPLASTKMYCADAMNLETTYLTILQNTNSYSITNNSMLTRSTGMDQLSFTKV